MTMILKDLARVLLSPVMSNVRLTPVAGMKNFLPPPKLEGIEFPERKKLKVLQKVPQYPQQQRPFKMQKRLRYMRGPELVHNTFLHKQFGIIALSGGRLKYNHIEMVRLTIARELDFDRMFAIWRIDAPWQPITKKGQGQRMGGGKGAIDHYVTPIKQDRVILEVGGACEYFEVKRKLQIIAHKLPFKAMAISQQELDRLKVLQEKLEAENLNPYNFKYIIQNNLGGCHNWIMPTDMFWFGKYL